MTNSEIRKWAKAKLKGHLWEVFPPLLVASILTNFSISFSNTSSDGSTTSTSYSLGWLFYFVSIGLAFFMVKFIKDEKCEFKDIFSFSKDFGRAIGACLLQALWIFLFALMLIIPGIIKAFGYALVPYLMADDKYKDVSIPDLLKKSEEMMKGHKWDYFCLGFSFIGWHILAIFTLFILEIWIGPYQAIAQAKFLNDIKEAAEGNAPKKEEPVKEEVTEEKKEEVL